MRKLQWHFKQQDKYATDHPDWQRLSFPADPTRIRRSEPPTQGVLAAHRAEKARRGQIPAELNDSFRETELAGNRLAKHFREK